MTELLKALNRIRVYLESNYPDIAEKLPAGLPLEKINETFKVLSYSLPQELYELCQYCSGWNWETENWDTLFAPYYGMTLCSPQGVVETAKVLDKVTYMNKPIIPIFGYDRTYLCLVGDWKGKHSPVVFVSELYHVELEYVSLVNMLQTSAEVWDTCVAYINESGFVECDERQFFSIYRKYNSELPKMVLTRFKKELELAGSDCRKLHNAWESIYAEIDSLTRCGWELSIDNFQSELIEPIVKEMNKKDKPNYISYAKQILEIFKYRF